MDLQGGEFYALKGAQKHLNNCQLIIAEGCPTHQYKSSDECKTDNIKLFLKQRGFIHANEGEKGDLVFLNGR